jgi:hypothetical protein
VKQIFWGWGEQMVINSISTIAYKCPVCGSIEFNNISVFSFSRNRQKQIRCSCTESLTEITLLRDKKVSIKIPCIACNDTHSFIIDLKKLWTKDIISFNCPNTDIELCFAGNDDFVRQSVDVYEMKMDLLMNDIGYEDYFINNTVMLDTIGKIHDVAEKGDLYCECGCSDIDLQMLSDRIELICKKCFSYEILMARTNKELKQTLKRDSIVLRCNMNNAVHGFPGE